MNPSVYAIPLIIVALVSLYLTTYTWKKYPSYVYFILFTLSAAIWAFGYMMELLMTDKGTKILWAKFEYIGIVVIPVALFATVLQYIGKENWLEKKKIASLFVIPAITLILVWTNEFHHLVWEKIELVDYGELSLLKISHGVYFWIHTFYSYSLITVSILLLSYAAFNFPSVYKKKTTALLIGLLIPWIGNIIYVFNLNPLQPVDLTPFTTFFSVIAIAFAILKLKSLDIVPIAREKIIETMHDAVIVVDNENNVIYANKSSREIFNFEELLKKLGDDVEGEKWKEAEINGKYYAISISPIYDAGKNEIGKVVIFHDITERKRTEDEIRNLNDDLMLINKIVRHDILNDLQVLRGFIEMECERDKKIYDKVIKRIEKIARLMRRVKDLEHLASTNALKEYDLKKVVESIAKEYEVKINISGNCRILADEAIYSVIDNILMNAVIHGKATQIDVTMEENGACKIKIADNGKGISDEIKGKIFDEKFSYGETKGSGLGLYIVKKVIDKYGGEIKVLDNSPHGAVFSITLKRK